MWFYIFMIKITKPSYNVAIHITLISDNEKTKKQKQGLHEDKMSTSSLAKIKKSNKTSCQKQG